MRSSCAVGAISCLLVAGVANDYRVSAQERLKRSNPFGHLFLSLRADGGIYEFEPVGSSQSSALGKRWTLTEINEAAVRTTKPYIEFDVNAKRFSGDGGRNFQSRL